MPGSTCRIGCSPSSPPAIPVSSAISTPCSRSSQRYDLTVADLANTPARPYGAGGAVGRPGGRASSRRALQQNCSGKHAGMLATCRINGWAIDSYLDPDHPLQERDRRRDRSSRRPTGRIGGRRRRRRVRGADPVMPLVDVARATRHADARAVRRRRGDGGRPVPRRRNRPRCHDVDGGRSGARRQGGCSGGDGRRAPRRSRRCGQDRRRLRPRPSGGDRRDAPPPRSSTSTAPWRQSATVSPCPCSAMASPVGALTALPWD